VRLVNDKGDSKIVAIAHLRVSGYLRREALKSANNATIVLRGPLFTKPVLSFLARYLTRRAHYCTTRLLDRAAPPASATSVAPGSAPAATTFSFTSAASAAAAAAAAAATAAAAAIGASTTASTTGTSTTTSTSTSSSTTPTTSTSSSGGSSTAPVSMVPPVPTTSSSSSKATTPTGSFGSLGSSSSSFLTASLAGSTAAAAAPAVTDSLVIAFDEFDQEDEESLQRWREKAAGHVFAVRSDDLLFRLLLAAETIEIDELYQICCERIEHALRHSPDAGAVRQLFELPLDFDHAQELRIAKENSWRPIKPDEAIELAGLGDSVGQSASADWYTGSNAMTLSVFYEKQTERQRSSSNPASPLPVARSDSTSLERDANWNWQNGDGAEELPDHAIPLVKLRRPPYNSHDDSVDRCQGPSCQTVFNTFNRKHHCRSCGTWRTRLSIMIVCVIDCSIAYVGCHSLRTYLL